MSAGSTRIFVEPRLPDWPPISAGRYSPSNSVCSGGIGGLAVIGIEDDHSARVLRVKEATIRIRRSLSQSPGGRAFAYFVQGNRMNVPYRRGCFFSSLVQVSYRFPPGREASKIAQDGAQRNHGTATWSRFRAP